MAVKTITIDMDAYERLAREKREGESFSQVIKRVLAARGMTARSLLETIKSIRIADETLESIEKVVRLREGDLVTAPPLEAEP
jgi:predicted CopG family antitoxin